MDIAFVYCGKTKIENNKRTRRVNASSAHRGFSQEGVKGRSALARGRRCVLGQADSGAPSGVGNYLSRLAVSA
jgi:hypothetical protein